MSFLEVTGSQEGRRVGAGMSSRSQERVILVLRCPLREEGRGGGCPQELAIRECEEETLPWGVGGWGEAAHGEGRSGGQTWSGSGCGRSGKSIS